MFLRRNRRCKKGEAYEYWMLVESVRTAKGPRQRVVATLGKLPGLDEDERAGWEEITRLLDGRPRDRSQRDLFEEADPPPQWAQVNLSGVRVERVRQFGQVYLALALWRRLGLHGFFEDHARSGREQIDWARVACILSVGRFCWQSSELALSEHWYANTALEDLIGVTLTESMLMIPRKSISGIFFPTERMFFSCQLCPRENCPARESSYDETLKEKYGLHDE